MKTQEVHLDPIIEEIHQIRRELVRESGGSLERLGEYLRGHRHEYAERLVTDRQIPLPDLSAFRKAK